MNGIEGSSVIFSVIMPTYNRYKLIEASLDSILNQSRRPDEIIICDDGSSDGTAGRARDILKFSGIPHKVLEITNSGPSYARRVAVDNSNGNWLAFLDSDDVWDSDYLESLEELICSGDYQFVVSDFRMIRAENVVEFPSKFNTAPQGFWSDFIIEDNNQLVFSGKNLFVKMLRFQPCFPSALACSRDAYDKVGGITLVSKKMKSEDAHFTRKLYFYCKGVFFFTTKVSILLHGENRSMSDDQSLDFVGKLIGRAEILKMLCEIEEIEKECGNVLRDEIAHSEVNIFSHLFWNKQYDEATSKFWEIRPKYRRPIDYARVLYSYFMKTLM